MNIRVATTADLANLRKLAIDAFINAYAVFNKETDMQQYRYHAINAKAHNLQRVNGITVDYNHRSIKLLEKLGLKFEKRFFMEGDPEELMLYSKDLNSPG